MESSASVWIEWKIFPAVNFSIDACWVLSQNYFSGRLHGTSKKINCLLVDRFSVLGEWKFELSRRFLSFVAIGMITRLKQHWARSRPYEENFPEIFNWWKHCRQEEVMKISFSPTANIWVSFVILSCSISQNVTLSPLSSVGFWVLICRRRQTEEKGRMLEGYK